MLLLVRLSFCFLFFQTSLAKGYQASWPSWPSLASRSQDLQQSNGLQNVPQDQDPQDPQDFFSSTKPDQSPWARARKCSSKDHNPPSPLPLPLPALSSIVAVDFFILCATAVAPALSPSRPPHIVMITRDPESQEKSAVDTVQHETPETNEPYAVHQPLKPPPTARLPPHRNSRASELAPIQTHEHVSLPQPHRDLEKQSPAQHSHHSQQIHHSPGHRTTRSCTDDSYISDEEGVEEEEDEEDEPKRHSVWILVRYIFHHTI